MIGIIIAVNDDNSGQPLSVINCCARVTVNIPGLVFNYHDAFTALRKPSPNTLISKIPNYFRLRPLGQGQVSFVFFNVFD